MDDVPEGKRSRTIQEDFHLKNVNIDGKHQLNLFSYRGPEQIIKTMFNNHPMRPVPMTLKVSDAVYITLLKRTYQQ